MSEIKFSLLTKSQLSRLSETSSNLGTVFFGSLVLPAFAGSVMPITGLLLGFVGGVAFVVLSLALEIGGKNG